MGIRLLCIMIVVVGVFPSMVAAQMMLDFGSYAAHENGPDPYQAERCPRPIQMNMLIDFSGSMGSSAHQNSMRALTITGNRLPLQTGISEHNPAYPVQLGAGAFAKDFYQVSSMTSSYDVFSTSVAKFRRKRFVDQSTNMEDAFSESLQAFPPRQFEQRANILVLILDGDYSSTAMWWDRYDQNDTTDPKIDDVYDELMMQQLFNSQVEEPEVYRERHQLLTSQKKLLHQIQHHTQNIDYVFILGQGKNVDDYFFRELQKSSEKVRYFGNNYAAMMDLILQTIYDSGCS